MDIRKVVASGNGALVLTIPASYRKTHNVKKGDAFTVETDENGRLVYNRLADPTVDIVDYFGDDDKEEE